MSVGEFERELERVETVEQGLPSVALVYQPANLDSRRLAEQCQQVVSEAGYLPRLLSAWELSPSLDRSGVRLAVTFGGDGTIIRAARWLAGSRTPIAGVAMGRLGFLTELPPEDACESIPSFLAGDYWIDERLMLAAQVEGFSGGVSDGAVPGTKIHGTPLIALNEIVLARGANVRAVQIDVTIDGVKLVQYLADGLILSTPTGSTAYALAAGGPVLAPGVQGLLMVPVSPHLAALRALVVPTSAKIELRAVSDETVMLVLDGQLQIPLQNHQPVHVGLAEETTLFARKGSPAHFYETLVESFKKRL